MRAHPRLVTFVCMTVLATACASRPSTNQTAPGEPMASQPAAPQPVAGEKEGDAMTVNLALVKKGYQAVKSGKRIAYCRSEVVTGTQFKRKVSMEKPRWSPACASPTCVRTNGASQ
jgi:hypothetical protein